VKRRACLALAVLWAVAAAAPAAAQGTATIYGCAGPDGAPLASSGGWLPDVLGPPAFVQASNRCLQAGSLQALLRSDGVTLVRGHYAAWRFSAPAGTRIVAYRLARSVRVVGEAGNTGSRPVYWMLTSENPSPPVAEQLVWSGASSAPEAIGSESGAGGAGNAFERAGRDLGYVELRIFCARNADGPCPAVVDDFARLRIYRAAVTLRDGQPPVPSSTSGSLATAPRLSGSAQAVVSASDAGLGLYRARVLVDGVARGGEASFGGADANCADVAPGSGGPHEFAAPVPCPLAAAAEVSLDTTALADGPHRVRVVVEDAAGNVADAVDRTVLVANAGSCPGAGPAGRITARFARGRRSRTVRFRHRARIAGRVRDLLGRPLAGAAVCVRSRVTRPGARDRGVRVVKTGASGRFRFRAPAGPSRVLRVVYGPPGAPPSCVLLRLGVRARVGLRATPQALRNGDTVRLRGRVRGRPYPLRGALVELQAFDGGRWRTFELTRARRPRGRFAASYRFSRTFSARSFRFRARLRPQDAYPYRRAASRPVRVFVRP
jgi:hypothetical protein